MTAYCYHYLVCLQRMGYFGEVTRSSALQLDEAGLEVGELLYCTVLYCTVLEVGELLYHFLRALDENSHEVVELQQPGPGYQGTIDSLYDGEDVISVIGAALNGVCSLFNNSCDVNTVKFHRVTIDKMRGAADTRCISGPHHRHDRQAQHQGGGRGHRLLRRALFPVLAGGQTRAARLPVRVRRVSGRLAADARELGAAAAEVRTRLGLGPGLGGGPGEAGHGRGWDAGGGELGAEQAAGRQSR